jgi:hypothetical protein
MTTPPEKVLKEWGATAVLELKEDFYDQGFKGGHIFLKKGTKGWTDMVWFGENEKDEIKNDFFNPHAIANTDYCFASGRVTFYWLSSGISKSIHIYPEDLKVIKKLPAWNKVFATGDFA